MTCTSLWTSRLADLDTQLDEGLLSPMELVEESLRRARSSHAAFTVVLEDEARTEARAATERRRRGHKLSALDGVPVAVKDCFDVGGTFTSNGSVVGRSPRRAVEDAAAVAQLRTAGAIVIGKTNLSELAFSGVGLNPHFGTPSNPLADGEPLVPGGSSSGSAVAVASGVVPLALGSDTSGSIRVPAAFCGLVGYKPSEGVISTRGMTPLAPTLDTAGFLVSTIGDLLTTLSAIGPVGRARAARRRGDVTEAADGHAQLRLVVPQGELLDECDDDVRSAFEDAVHSLEQHPRISVERQRMRALERAQFLLDAQGTIVSAEASSRYRDLADVLGPMSLDPDIARRLRTSAVRADTARELRRQLPGLRRSYAEELQDRLLCCPTVRHLPPTIRQVRASAEAFDSLNARTLRTTMLLSVLGAPGVSIPVGGGAPVGMLLSAAPNGDGSLLQHLPLAAEALSA